MSKKKQTRKSKSEHSSLADHKRNKKTLTPPLKGIGNLQLHSWKDERLPEMLWAALLAKVLPREEYLELFRVIGKSAEHFPDNKIYITHSGLALLGTAEFKKIMSPILDNQAALSAISPLKLFKTLPDRHHWETFLPDTDEEAATQQLGEAIAQCLFHQSQTATDLRWLKVLFRIVQGNIIFPEKMEERVNEILEYPNRGDMRSVRPFIRSMEPMTTTVPDTDQRSEWAHNFWNECFENTECVGVLKHRPKSEFHHESTNRKWGEIYAECARHCMNTIKTTAIDARHDGTFGLALYGLSLVASSFRPFSTRPSGRVTLRALVETYLTLAYLVKKDEPKLWQTYRVYGGGQAKLAFLKLTETTDLPRYVDLDTLEQLANEDMWQEFVDIDLGHWASKDLRRMSEDVGVKNIYDKYYGWPSAFVHAQWAAVRNTVFELCLNPLHRMHRMPRPPRLDLEDVSWDAIKLGNLILDLVNEAYPPFKPRFSPSDLDSAPNEDATSDPLTPPKEQ